VKKSNASRVNQVSPFGLLKNNAAGETILFPLAHEPDPF
jgi:hypothetical protein